jgi:hypothetical protein
VLALWRAEASVSLLTRCRHGKAVRDHGGAALYPPCGCGDAPPADQEQQLTEKGLARLRALGTAAAIEVSQELSAALERRAYPGHMRAVWHLAGRCSDAEWAGVVARWRAKKATDPN